VELFMGMRGWRRSANLHLVIQDPSSFAIAGVGFERSGSVPVWRQIGTGLIRLVPE
jgi:hypothetical protein